MVGRTMDAGTHNEDNRWSGFGYLNVQAQYFGFYGAEWAICHRRA